MLELPRPGVLPVDASPALTACLLDILVGMREVRPDLGMPERSIEEPVLLANGLVEADVTFRTDQTATPRAAP